VDRMNLVEDMDPIYAFHGQNYIVTREKLEKIRKKIRDDTRIKRLDMLNSMEEESKENLRKEKFIQYYRRNKAHVGPQYSDSQPPPKLTTYPFPLSTNPTPSSTSHKSDDI